uniref:Uncharacterized protein n=1 Tax=Myoviridae sp. ctwSu1 TaxID=2825207 RepID=A0A8S5U183_9CAUD|nr:MAG TPA: hypothetical protein [Myoviridae sp. ctwSu1]
MNSPCRNLCFAMSAWGVSYDTGSTPSDFLF